jgi:threonine aldolase
MRFLSAQLIALYEGDLWLRNATHANAMATRLYEQVKDLVPVAAPQANALFPILPAQAIEPLQEQVRFYVWDHTINQVRWMCAWDTTQDDVDNFAALVRAQLGK